MIGIVSHDFFSELSNREIEEGIAGEQRDHMLQVSKFSYNVQLFQKYWNIERVWYNENYILTFQSNFVSDLCS